MSRRTYDDIAPYYDSGMRWLERWFLARVRAKTLSLLPANGRVLEVGAGTGLNFAFYHSGWEGVASEPSIEMLKIAKSKKRPDAVELIQSEAEHLPFRDDSFDAAFATLVFCSVTSQQQAFTELRRVVKRGGVVVLFEHVRPAGPLGVLFDLLNLITVALFGDHVNRRTAIAAQLAGLHPVRVDKHMLGIFNLIDCRV